MFGALSTRKKKSDRPFQYDRFIPSRDHQSDVDLLSKTVSETMSQSSEQSAYVRYVADTLLGKGYERRRVLNFFAQKPPIVQKEINKINPPQLDQNQSQMKQQSPRSVTMQNCFVPKRTMDAPGIMDDFYSHTIGCTKERLLLALHQGPEKCSTLYTTDILNYPDERTSSYTISSFDDTRRGRIIRVVQAIDEGTFIAGCSDGVTQLYQLEEQKPIKTMSIGADAICAMVSVSASCFVAGMYGGDLRFVDLRARKPLNLTIKAAHGGQIPGLIFDGQNTLATGANDATVKLWDMRFTPAVPVAMNDFHYGAVKALYFHSSRYLISGGGTSCGRFCVWDVLSDRIVDVVNAGSQITGIQSLQNPNYVVSSHGYRGCNLKLWSIKNNRLVCVSSTPVPQNELDSTRILSLVVSPKQDTLVALQSNEQIRFFNVKLPKKRIIAPILTPDAMVIR